MHCDGDCRACPAGLTRGLLLARKGCDDARSRLALRTLWHRAARRHSTQIKADARKTPSAANRPQPNQSKDRAGVSGRRYRAGSANSEGNRKQRKKRKSRACMGLGLPRFRGRSVIWESGTDDATAFSPSSHKEAFFGSAPGGAILPSRPALWCGCRAQRRSRIAEGDRLWRREASLTGASTAAGCDGPGSTAAW